MIGLDKKVRVILTYPPTTCRNFAELLRAIGSQQLSGAEKVATPVNWKPGEEVIIPPSLSNEGAKPRFPQG